MGLLGTCFVLALVRVQPTEDSASEAATETGSELWFCLFVLCFPSYLDEAAGPEPAVF